MDTPVLIDQAGISTPITDPAFVIGRGESAQLLIDLPALSRQHASIILRNDLRYVCDLGSRNGTFLNGVRLTDTPERLTDGDVITLGGIVTLRFRDPSQTVGGSGIGRVRGVWIAPARQEVWVDAILLAPPLSRQQYALLALLYDAPGRIFTREEIAQHLWPQDKLLGIDSTLVAVDGLVKRTQARLKAVSRQDASLQFVRGRGIRLLIDTDA
jgi:pSer/pThr/pTyr-binding forkhead associated (FHA) protein